MAKVLRAAPEATSAMKATGAQMRTMIEAGGFQPASVECVDEVLVAHGQAFEKWPIMLPMYRNTVNTMLHLRMNTDYGWQCCSYETFNFLPWVANW
jgi:hypothetical protein